MELSIVQPFDPKKVPVESVAQTARAREVQPRTAEELSLRAPEPGRVSKESENVRTSSIEIDTLVADELSSDLEIGKAAEKVDELFTSFTNRVMEFFVDQETGKRVIQLKDRETGELIRQIPQQDYLDMVAALNKIAQNMLKDLPKYI